MARSPSPLLVFFFGLALLGAGCSPIVATRGHMVDEERLAAVEAGITSKDEVWAILGSPTATGTFSDDTWYYIGQITERTAFFKPEAVERKVLIVKFDEFDVVSETELLDLSAGQEVAMSEMETPTAGREMGFLEQFLGNIGRFSGGESSRVGPGAPVGR